MKSGANKTKEKFNSILKTQKERDELMLISIKIGVFVSKIDGVIDPSELEEINKLCLFINNNPTTPAFIKKEVNKIINSDITFNEINSDVKSFLQDRWKKLQFYIFFIQRIGNQS